MPLDDEVKFHVTASAVGFGKLSSAAKKESKSLNILGGAMAQNDLADSVLMAMKAYQAGVMSVEDARAALGIDEPEVSTAPPYKGPINVPCSACSAGDSAMQYHDHDHVPQVNRRYVMGVDVGPGKSYAVMHRRGPAKKEGSASLQPPVKQVKKERRLALDKNI